ncbi:hypothetical protein BGZ50_006859 [Haplosporangium sp. Z 11]|nr:hypothetical protein BGZ50_006859 [Haplosporangium sp. Z 11]
MRRMYKGYEILLTLLKFDVFFFVAYAIQMFTLVDATDKMVLARFSDGRTLSRHQVLIGLAIPASAILLMLAFFGVMKENKIATIIVMVCLTCAEPYFIYQLVYLHMPANGERFINSLKYLTFFSSVTMVLVLITLFFMVYCFRNFDKGLLVSEKSRIVGQRKPFEIDEDPSDGVPSALSESPREDDDSSQQLMAYSALKIIQETHHIKPNDERTHHSRQHQDAGPSSNERVYNDKMEID